MLVHYKKYVCEISWGHYDNGSIAIQLVDDEGPAATATVNLWNPRPDPGSWDKETEVWIKDWSENEGMCEALVKSGVVTMTGRTCETGFVVAKHAKLTPAALAELNTVRGTK